MAAIATPPRQLRTARALSSPLAPEPTSEISTAPKAMQAATDRYGEMPSYARAEALLNTALTLRTPLEPNTSEFRAVEALVKKVSAHYVHTDQYHNATHALHVSAFIHLFAELADANLPQSPRHAALRVAKALFHDSANQKSPGIPGTDELNSAILFLRGTKSGSLNSSTESDGIAEKLLSQFTPAERIEGFCHILGTVFRDRFCSENNLATIDYIKQAAVFLKRGLSLGICAQDISNFEKKHKATGNLALAIAREIHTPEALILKHADIYASLTAECSLANNINNFREDRGKAHTMGVDNPIAYSRGFVSFLQGKAHASIHSADSDSPIAKRIGENPEEVLFGLGERVAKLGGIGIEVVNITMDYWNEKCGSLLKNIYKLVQSGHDVGAMRLENLVDLLAKENPSVRNHSRLGSLTAEEKVATISSLAPQSLNLLFAGGSEPLPTEIFALFELELKLLPPVPSGERRNPLSEVPLPGGSGQT